MMTNQKSKLEKKIFRKPIAVLISDIHYNINTLDVADKALNLAISKANELRVELIVCGDFHDTKANIRAECVAAISKTIERATYFPNILRGNHDSINEKSKEHALSFLRSSCVMVVDSTLTTTFRSHTSHLIPYHHDADELRTHLKTIPPRSVLIMHQGVIGSTAGHYFQDKSALNKEDLAGHTVFSGHYHTRQTFDLPDGGSFTYLGNPFTLGFGEANDPEKGYHILYDDNSLEFVPTNLRKHVVVEAMIGDLDHVELWEHEYNPGDLLWVKLKGDSQYLNISKSEVAKRMGITGEFKLDLIPNDTVTTKPSIENKSPTTVLDDLIDSLTNTDDSRKARIKLLYKQLVNGDK